MPPPSRQPGRSSWARQSWPSPACRCCSWGLPSCSSPSSTSDGGSPSCSSPGAPLGRGAAGRDRGRVTAAQATRVSRDVRRADTQYPVDSHRPPAQRPASQPPVRRRDVRRGSPDSAGEPDRRSPARAACSAWISGVRRRARPTVSGMRRMIGVGLPTPPERSSDGLRHAPHPRVIRVPQLV